jgi:hypothetical protein
VRGAFQKANYGRHLLEEVVEPLALPVGLGPGGLLAGLALAQGLRHGVAVVLGRVRKAGHQQLALAPGRHVEVVVEAVGLVVHLKAAGLPGLDALVEVKRAGRPSVGEASQQGGAGLGRKPRHALRGRVEVLVAEVRKPGAVGPRIARAQQHEGG